MREEATATAGIGPLRRGEGGVRIGRLRLRVPGSSAEEGRAVAAAVGARLAEGLTSRAEGRVGGLRLRVPVGAAAPSTGALAEAVADAVSARLGGSRRA